MRTLEELCCTYIGLLRSIYLIEQSLHWAVNGSNFYGNHLLFERLYRSAAEDTDLAAERFTGLFGDECLDIKHQAEVIQLTLKSLSGSDPIQMATDAETKFLSFAEAFYAKIEKLDKMTLGLSDALTSISSNRETSLYLLNQANKDGDHMKRSVASRIATLKQAQQITVEPEALQAKLQRQLFAIVPSYVVGKYNSSDISVSVDVVNKRISAQVKLPAAASEDVQRKIEDNFKAFTLLQLPPQLQQSFMIMVGFVMPPAGGYQPLNK
jgi:DNA-binding ferritin-like protein